MSIIGNRIGPVIDSGDLIGDAITIGGGGPAIQIDQLDVSAAGTYSAPSGHAYDPVVVPAGTEGTPTASKGAVQNHTIDITPSVTNTGGYISGGTHAGTPISVAASELVSGTKSITANGSAIDVTEYAAVDVNVPASGVTPTPYTVSGSGTFNAPSGYAYDPVTVPAAGTPSVTVTKGAVVNHEITVSSAYSESQAGWIPVSSGAGGSATVSASELVSGTKSITANGSAIDVTEYAAVDVNVVSTGKLPQVADRSVVSLDAADFGSITSIGSFAFRLCTNLISVVLPNTITVLNAYSFESCSHLETINIPPNLIDVANFAFGSCQRLTNFVLNEGMTAIKNSVFFGCSAVETGIIPSTITQIQTSAFKMCSGLKELRFQSSTPPTIQNADALPNPAAVTNFVYIPYDYSDAYIQRTNYPTNPLKYTGYKTFANGASLPAADPSSAWECVWYATKLDAENTTNPITLGNGNEVYCRFDYI